MQKKGWLLPTCLCLLLFAFWQCNLPELDFLEVRTGEPVSLLDEPTLEIFLVITGLNQGIVTDHGHLWSLSDSLPTFPQSDGSTSLGETPDNGQYTSRVDVSGFLPDTTYYFRAFAIPEGGEVVYSENVTSFATASVLVSPTSFSEINIISYRLSASVSTKNPSVVLRHGHIWSANDSLPVLESTLSGKTEYGSLTNPDFQSLADSLLPFTGYYARGYAISLTDTAYGAVEFFQTGQTTVRTVGVFNQFDDDNIPTVKAFGSIRNLATLGDLGFSVSEYGHEWVIDLPNGTTYRDTSRITELMQDTVFCSALPSTIESAIYTARAYAVLTQGGAGQVLEAPESRSVDAQTGFWQYAGPFPGPASSGLVHFHYGGELYAGLGQDLSGQRYSDLYDFSSGNGWNPVPVETGFARSGSVAFVLGDTAYIGLGENQSGLQKNFYKSAPPGPWQLLEDTHTVIKDTTIQDTCREVLLLDCKTGATSSLCDRAFQITCLGDGDLDSVQIIISDAGGQICSEDLLDLSLCLPVPIVLCSNMDTLDVLGCQGDSIAQIRIRSNRAVTVPNNEIIPTPFPGAAGRAGIGFSNGGFGFAGLGIHNEAKLYRFDPNDTLLWQSIPLPGPESENRINATGFSLGNAFYLGWSPGEDGPYEFYRFQSGTWAFAFEVEDAPEAYQAFALNDGKGYLALQFDSGVIELFTYDPASAGPTRIPGAFPLRFPLGPFGFGLNGQAYVSFTNPDGTTGFWSFSPPD